MPANKDLVFGEQIISNASLDELLVKDKTMEAAKNLTPLGAALFAWYPFKREDKVLQIGNNGFGNTLKSLSNRCKELQMVEINEYKKNKLSIISKNYKNTTIISNVEDAKDNYFDYVIFSMGIDNFPQKTVRDYCNFIGNLKSKLVPSGKLLLTVPNRIGVRYLSGNPTLSEGIPFADITDDNDVIYQFVRKEYEDTLKISGFKNVKMYYPYPDEYMTQLIYSDNFVPSESIGERLRAYIKSKSSTVMDENKLCTILAKNGSLSDFCNSFIAECGNDKPSNVLYSAISSERVPERIFATNILGDDTVEKIPVYPEGKAGVSEILRNTDCLLKRKIPVLELSSLQDRISMRRVKSPTLAEHIRNLISDGKSQELLSCIDKLYEYILASSETTNRENNQMLHYDRELEWGPILKTAFIEMIPVNCFYEDGKFLFFDQEYTKENFPALYVLFRGIRDIYAFIPSAENLLPLSVLAQRYGLDKLWKYMQTEEGLFQNELRQINKYRYLFSWAENNNIVMKQNREMLRINSICDVKEPTPEVFNSISGIGNRKIILFGAGKMAEYFLDKYGASYKPEFIIDNSSELWGTTKWGLEVKSPDALREMVYGTYRVIIASNAYIQIADQLEKIGVLMDSYRIYVKRTDDLLSSAITNTTSDGKYNVGFVTGAFDLFHIGHINVLKNSKARSNYLIAGVLTDEIIKEEKHKTPFIPFEERLEIVKQCKYVDRVVPVDGHNTNKIDAWRELRYGCLFSGSDHEFEPYWIWLRRELQCLGSNLEIFPYTQSTSSTMLQKVISDSIK